LTQRSGDKANDTDFLRKTLSANGIDTSTVDVISGFRAALGPATRQRGHLTPNFGFRAYNRHQEENLMAAFQGRTAVITGAAEGIGAAISRSLWAGGADLAAVDIKPVDMARITNGRGRADQRFFSYECDATSSEDVARTCRLIESDLGPVSILVNNVGGGGNEPADDIETLTDEQWEFVISLTLSSGMRFCRALVGGMKARKYGRIINISSSLKDGVFGPVGTVRGRLPYITCKNAVIGLTRQLANDLGPFGISVNAVSPGLTLPGEDARITQRFHALPPEEQARLFAHIPLGRLANGEDIANAVCFLAAEASGYISGETLTVTGGGYR
jgi:NAD(P)-dependent dehydrogenase (short-subunit alcohol dehydrogenase family)